MKRTWVLITLLACLAIAPVWSSARVNFSVEMIASELPMSTVETILKKVDLQTDYTYDQLMAGYRNGTVKITQVASGYAVCILNADGAGDTVLIANL